MYSSPSALSEIVLDVEQRAQILAHALALLDPDRHVVDGPVDHHSEYPADRFSPELQVEEVQAVTLGDARGGLTQAIQIGQNFPQKQKSGQTPT